jgi:hypothetical protein
VLLFNLLRLWREQMCKSRRWTTWVYYDYIRGTRRKKKKGKNTKRKRKCNELGLV